jgi:ATP-binding cassette subfamily B protein
VLKNILKKNSSLFWVLERIKGYKRHILFLMIGNMIFALCIVMFSLGCRELVDGAVASDMGQIKRYALVLLGIVFLRLFLRLSVNGLYEYTRGKLTNKIRQDTLHQLLRKDYAALQKFHSGELINRMFSDTNVVVDGVLGILPPVVNMATRLIGAVIILFRLDWRFTLVFLVVGCALFTITRLLRSHIKSLHKQVQEKEGLVHAILQEVLGNIRLIKASDMEKTMEEKVEANQGEFFKAQMQRRKYTVTGNAGMGFVFQMGYLYALVWGGIQISLHAMSYGTLTAILQLVGQIQTPFSGMSGSLQKFYGMISSAERLEELYQLEDEDACDYQSLPEVSQSIGRDFQTIAFESVDFAYDRLEVLKNINFEIQPGDCIALTGLSGAGKTTLFSLLLGIYRPTSGNVSVVMAHGEEKAGKRTRKLFAYVPQGNTLFSGTLRENITMFCPNAEEKDVWNAAEAACIREFIEEQPQGLDTVIGERGIGLSEGQAQRIAVARAILSGAPVLLLDEPTSALDSETEEKLLQNISAMKDKTCMIVTHRPAVLSMCNKCLQLENGVCRWVEKD